MEVFGSISNQVTENRNDSNAYTVLLISAQCSHTLALTSPQPSSATTLAAWGLAFTTKLKSSAAVLLLLAVQTLQADRQ